MPAPRMVIQPLRPQAGQPLAAADEALDVEGHGRLGERVVAGPEAGRARRPEHGVGELVEQAAQVGQRGALVDHQALDLEELEAVAGVDRLVAEAAAGHQGADGRRRGAHDPDLAPGEVWVRSRSRLACRRVAGRVARRACPTGRARVVGRDVERLEVELVGLDLRALVDHEAELAEDARDLALRLAEGVQRAARAGAGRAA